jgi:hypothetical protein
MESIGGRPAQRDVDVSFEGSEQVEMVLPKAEDLAAYRCRPGMQSYGPHLVYGMVRGRDKRAVADARVLLEWTGAGRTSGRNGRAYAEPFKLHLDADENGRWAACVPARVQVTASVLIDEKVVLRQPVSLLTGQPLTHMDLTIP